MFIGSHWRGGIKAKFKVESANVNLSIDKTGGPAEWHIDGKIIVNNSANYAFPDEHPRTIELVVDDPALVKNVTIVADKGRKIENTVSFVGAEGSHKNVGKSKSSKVRVDINPF